MATTYTDANSNTANSLAERINYIKTLADEIVVAETKTSEMRADSRLIEAFGDSAEVKVRTVDFTDQELEDMGINGAYPLGQVKMTWQTIKLENYKGKAFDIGHVQGEKSGFPDEATYDISEFTRQIVVPTLDKSRIAKMVSLAGNTESGSSLTTANVLTAIRNGINTLADAYNRDSGLTIYMPNSTAALLDASTELGAYRDITNGTRAVTTRVDSIDGNTIIRVPNSYMTTAAFAIHAPDTVQAITELSIKHVPDGYNVRGHGDFIGFDAYYDTICLANKKKGVYAYTISG